MEQDWADRHIERWRDHWIDVPFDDDVEAVVVRMGRLSRYFKQHPRAAIADLGLDEHEYETLHHLVIRDTPGHASPGALATDLGISGAGMTGRLDTLEAAGWVRRSPHPDDRRRVEVQITDAGMDLWRRAMAVRGRAEDEVLSVLSPDERAHLAALLKRMTLHAEGHDAG